MLQTLLKKSYTYIEVKTFEKLIFNWQATFILIEIAYKDAYIRTSFFNEDESHSNFLNMHTNLDKPLHMNTRINKRRTPIY